MSNSIIALGITITKGNVFVSRFGYEQTNVNFYQVIAVKGKTTIVVREIEKEKKYEGSMHGSAIPLIDKFCGEPITRRVREYSDVPLIVLGDCENAYLSLNNKEYDFSDWG